MGIGEWEMGGGVEVLYSDETMCDDTIWTLCGIEEHLREEIVG